MSQMIDRLEKAKLVYRSEDLTDARTCIVRLTENGKTTIHRAETLWVEVLSGPFEQLTTEENNLLVQLTTKLAVSLPQRGRDTNE